MKQVKIRDKVKKEYLRRIRKLLETPQNCWNLIKGMNTWAILFVWYSGLFLKWTREKLKQMDQRTRKLTKMHKALYLKDDFDRLYVSRKEGWRVLTSFEESVDASMQWPENYIEKRGGRIITVTRNNTDNMRSNWTEISRKQKCEKNSIDVLSDN